jgi:hypothetical protein
LPSPERRAGHAALAKFSALFSSRRILASLYSALYVRTSSNGEAPAVNYWALLLQSFRGSVPCFATTTNRPPPGRLLPCFVCLAVAGARLIGRTVRERKATAMNTSNCVSVQLQVLLPRHKAQEGIDGFALQPCKCHAQYWSPSN